MVEPSEILEEVDAQIGTLGEAHTEEDYAEPEEANEEEGSEEDNAFREVDSSMILGWGYTDGLLEVQFLNGRTESYGISPEEWAEARDSSSPGKWLHQNVL